MSTENNTRKELLRKELLEKNTPVRLTEKLPNIRLIATDLDGTLFTDSLRLPKSFPDILTALNAKGIHFATASGRNWATQKEYFRNQAEQISFICDNGAFLVQHQQPVFISELSPSLWMDIADKCNSYGDDCRAILCGVNGTYVLNYKNNPRLTAVIEHFYIGLSQIADIREIHDQIFKVSICFLGGTGGSFYDDFSSAYSERASVLRTAEYFMDIMNHGISKGTGLQFLQEQLHISPDETVVFGDFENDICLFEQAAHTFIMENAPLSMHKYAKYLAPSNEQEGVTEIIKRYIL